MRTYEEFARENYPQVADAYEIQCLIDSGEIIGKTVVAIRSGFSCTGGGTEMIVSKIEGNNVKLNPTEKSQHLNKLGWGTTVSSLPKDVKLVK